MHRESKEPTVINLKEITTDGETYNYTSETGELTDTLKDLISGHNYKISIEIRSMGDAYEVCGEVKTSLDLTCSRCAFEFEGPLYFKINELLMVEDQSQFSNGSQSRQNYITHNGDNELFCHMIPSSMFDIAEFIHEQIAINEPLHPTGKANCDDTCENLKEALEKGWLNSDQKPKDPTENTHRPFQSLSKLLDS